jgi:hypothetical protein
MHHREVGASSNYNESPEQVYKKEAEDGLRES